MASRLHRLIGLDAAIRAGGYPGVEFLCRLFEVQPRTLHQDIRELREHFHLDIRFDRTCGGYYNANPVQRLPPLALTYEQSLLTAIAIEMLCHYGGLAFRGLLATVTEAVVNAKHRALPAHLKEVITFAPPNQADLGANLFIAVVHACLEHRRLTLTMKGEAEQDRQGVLAQKLLFANGVWWLVAEAGGDEIRVALGSIAAVGAT